MDNFVWTTDYQICCKLFWCMCVCASLSLSLSLSLCMCVCVRACVCVCVCVSPVSGTFGHWIFNHLEHLMLKKFKWLLQKSSRNNMFIFGIYSIYFSLFFIIRALEQFSD